MLLLNMMKLEGGLRVLGKPIPYHTKMKPLVTVITVSLNSEKHIEQTIQSIINQSYDNIEYIIIDGGSTDRTLEIIRKYENDIVYWCNEKDYGIYDAMNKGVFLSNGEYLCFLNSDDFFYSNKSVKHVIPAMKERVDFIYGDVCFMGEGFQKVEIAKRNIVLRDLLFWNMAHLTIFCRKDILIKFGGFDLQYKLAADYDFISKCFRDRTLKKVYVNKIIAVFRVVGISNRNIGVSLSERSRIIRKNFPFIIFIIALVWLWMYHYPKTILSLKYPALRYYVALLFLMVKKMKNKFVKKNKGCSL